MRFAVRWEQKMENNFNTPLEVIRGNLKGAQTKASLSIGRMILLGMMAGAFIAFGGAASNVAAHGIADVGLSRLVMAVVFPVGLMLVVLTGAELFTGNCLMTMAAWNRDISWKALLRSLTVVYVGNLAGALVVDVLIFYSGQFDYSGGNLGAFAIKVAVGKAGMTPGRAVISGILCNIVVCLAVLAAGAARDVIGKIGAVFFPIMAFVICGFEHCVANMFYLPAGILASTNPVYAAKAAELYGITSEQCANLLTGSISRLFLVSVGNVLGGVVFVSLVFYTVYKKDLKSLQ